MLCGIVWKSTWSEFQRIRRRTVAALTRWLRCCRSSTTEAAHRTPVGRTRSWTTCARPARSCPEPASTRPSPTRRRRPPPWWWTCPRPTRRPRWWTRSRSTSRPRTPSSRSSRWCAFPRCEAATSDPNSRERGLVPKHRASARARRADSKKSCASRCPLALYWWCCYIVFLYIDFVSTLQKWVIYSLLGFNWPRCRGPVGQQKIRLKMIFEACHDLIVMGKLIVSQKLGYLRDATGGLYYKKRCACSTSIQFKASTCSAENKENTVKCYFLHREKCV